MQWRVQRKTALEQPGRKNPTWRVSEKELTRVWKYLGFSRKSEKCDGQNTDCGLTAALPLAVSSLSCVWLCDPMDCSLSGSSAIFPGNTIRMGCRFLPGGLPHVSRTGGRLPRHWATAGCISAVNGGYSEPFPLTRSTNSQASSPLGLFQDTLIKTSTTYYWDTENIF